MRARRSDSSRTAPFLVLSLLIHLLVVLFLRLPPLHHPEPRPLSIEFIERPRPPVLAKPAEPVRPPERGTVVEVPIEQPTDEPVETKYLAEKSQKVERDTWRPDLLPQGMPSPGAPSKTREQAAAPSVAGKAAPAPTEAEARAERREQAAERPSPAELARKTYTEGEWFASKETTREAAERAQKAAEQAKETPSPSLQDLLPTGAQLARVAPPGGRNEYLPDLERGDATRVSTREFKHYSYYVKLREKVSLAWDFPREGQGRDGRVAVKIAIEPNGTLRTIELIRSSGFEPFDAEALEAVRLGAPFDPTPAEIRDTDGLLVLTLNFHYIGGAVFRLR